VTIRWRRSWDTFLFFPSRGRAREDSLLSSFSPIIVKDFDELRLGNWLQRELVQVNFLPSPSVVIDLASLSSFPLRFEEKAGIVH